MRLKTLIGTVLTAVLATTGAMSQQTEEVVIQVEQVAKNVYMLQGRGGNIGVSVGEDGIFLIDDQYAPVTDGIVEAIRRVSEEPIRFVINTHWHFDHTGGNENFGNKGVLIIAHDNVRKRMSVDQFMEDFGREVKASPKVALPVVTFDSATTLHMNDDSVKAFHVENAHTDGDAIIHFTKQNVFHMGDIFFNKLYPFIDSGSGGSVDGVIAAANMILEMADDETVIIPGHGPLSNKAELTEYRDMLVTVRDRISALIAQGKTQDEVMAAAPTAEFDAEWGSGFLPVEQWVPIIYKALGGQ